MSTPTMISIPVDDDDRISVYAADEYRPGYVAVSVSDATYTSKGHLYLSPARARDLVEQLTAALAPAEVTA